MTTLWILDVSESQDSTIQKKKLKDLLWNINLSHHCGFNVPLQSYRTTDCQSFPKDPYTRATCDYPFRRGEEGRLMWVGDVGHCGVTFKYRIAVLQIQIVGSSSKDTKSHFEFIHY